MKKKWSSILLAAVLAICGVFCGCEKKTESLVLYVPDGAPAMAFAPMMETQREDVEYRVVAPNLIASKVTNTDMEKNADLCVLPVTAAAKLIGDGSRYLSLGVVTSGNLYVLSKDPALKSELESKEYRDVSCLIGKTIGVMKINDVPGLTFKSALDGYGVEWQEMKNGDTVSATKVNLKAIADATSIDPTDDTVAAYLVAEPAASVQIAKNKFSIVYSLEDLYLRGENVQEGGYQGFPQAILVAKKSVVTEKKDWLDRFLNELAESMDKLHGDWANGEKIVALIQSHLEDRAYASTLKASVLSKETIARCKIGFIENAKSKAAVQAYLTRIVATDALATKTVNDEFFYMG